MEQKVPDTVEPGSISAVVRAGLGAEEAGRLLALVRPSVGFTVRPDLADAESVIGGAPSAPESFVWPDYQGEPMLLLAQVDCGQAARLLGEDWTLPADGRLLFFHDDDFSARFSFDDGDDGCRVLHVPAGAEAMTEQGRGRVIPALPLEARALPSVPGWEETEAYDAAGGDVMALLALDEALSALLPRPRHRLLGWCDTGDTPRPQGHRPLLQLEAEAGTAWGEVVNVSFWIREGDLRTGDLSRVRRSYEVA
ncbi:DUF1963 domain-containing protein [Streptacidiphilus jiangxiensis]|uniref:DUF1963 domain-containing protein n=1 Tax=Streptacidiphilus jiangxiensis TaxID=235985 RepID=A0A1H7Z359_STRJI|nr:DUF1963 domain-containing protein [Streptacidiphilus jiangxiensis]SEM52900.1 protein of unknown function [Streptacidiphilus jiangxiensis]